MKTDDVSGAIHLKEKFARISDRWQPRIVAQVNDYHVKAAKIQGAFVWHTHEDTDELFFVHRGTLRLEFRNGAVDLGPGDIYVVPRGREHRPIADEECEILLFEPAGTRNTGAVESELTVYDPEWL